MIVVDTNIIGYLYLTSEFSALAEQVLLKDPDWAAPLLWRSEFRNVLTFYIRKHILSVEEAVRIMEEAITLLHGGEYETTSFQVLQLVVESDCSAYDCEFAALARDLGVPLVTLDKQLLDQFPNDTIALDAYVKQTK
jgi:predicted nucleic acid-binding protein